MVSRGACCSLHDDCLSCPYPACVRDIHHGAMVLRIRQRYQDMYAYTQHYTTAEASVLFCVSERTVRRAIKYVVSLDKGGNHEQPDTEQPAKSKVSEVRRSVIPGARVPG